MCGQSRGYQAIQREIYQEPYWPHYHLPHQQCDHEEHSTPWQLLSASQQCWHLRKLRSKQLGIFLHACLLVYYPTFMAFWHFLCYQDIALQDPLFSDEMGHHIQVGLDSLTCLKVASEGYIGGLQIMSSAASPSLKHRVFDRRFERWASKVPGSSVRYSLTTGESRLRLPPQH